jgi:exodeoxyribonuclease VII large subunit
MSADSELDKIYSVSEITRDIKSLLESEFQSVWIEGEISNYLFHSSGHRYFTLKDESAQIKAVIWKFSSQGLKVDLKDGMKVRVFGDITVYEKGGNYQIRVLKVESVGKGSLAEQFQKLKEKLQREGLFDPQHKKEIPRFPQAIGVITSPTGAAIRDIINVCRRRAAMIRLVIRPTRVQGDSAAEDIAKAIKEMNEFAGVDVIILGRGGGSLEDLWAFNEEVVARAVFDSNIPIISAVGHETDFSISDFVADLRAATPSAAAEIATYDAVALRLSMANNRDRILRSLAQIVHKRHQELALVIKSRVFLAPLEIVEPRAQKLDDLISRLKSATELVFIKNNNRHELLKQKLEAISPDRVLSRGYAVVRKAIDNTLVKSTKSLATGERIMISFSDGSKGATVE